MMLPRKLEGLARELKEDSPASEKLFRVAQKGLRSLGLHPAFSIERCVIVELRQPPKLTRGLSDLLIRRATERDIPALVKLDNRDAGLIEDATRPRRPSLPRTVGRGRRVLHLFLPRARAV